MSCWLAVKADVVKELDAVIFRVVLYVLRYVFAYYDFVCWFLFVNLILYVQWRWWSDWVVGELVPFQAVARNFSLFHSKWIGSETHPSSFPVNTMAVCLSVKWLCVVLKSRMHRAMCTFMPSYSVTCCWIKYSNNLPFISRVLSLQIFTRLRMVFIVLFMLLSRN